MDKRFLEVKVQQIGVIPVESIYEGNGCFYLETEREIPTVKEITKEWNEDDEVIFSKEP